MSLEYLFSFSTVQFVLSVSLGFRLNLLFKASQTRPIWGNSAEMTELKLRVNLQLHREHSKLRAREDVDKTSSRICFPTRYLIQSVLRFANILLNVGACPYICSLLSILNRPLYLTSPGIMSGHDCLLVSNWFVKRKQFTFSAFALAEQRPKKKCVWTMVPFKLRWHGGCLLGG